MRDNKKPNKLMELMSENPSLPLLFFARDKHIPLNEPFSFYQYSDCYISEAYTDEKGFYPTLDCIKDNYIDRLAEGEKIKDLDPEELGEKFPTAMHAQNYEDFIEDYISENVEHYTAIVVDIE